MYRISTERHLHWHAIVSPYEIKVHPLLEFLSKPCVGSMVSRYRWITPLHSGIWIRASQSCGRIHTSTLKRNVAHSYLHVDVGLTEFDVAWATCLPSGSFQTTCTISITMTMNDERTCMLLSCIKNSAHETNGHTKAIFVNKIRGIFRHSPAP